MVNTHKLKSMRVLKKLSQQRIADLMRMNVMTYSAKENGIREFTVSEFLELCEILECSFDDIFMPKEPSKTNNND